LHPVLKVIGARHLVSLRGLGYRFDAG